MDTYRKMLSLLYSHLLDGPCHNLRITGILHFNNGKQIWIGNNVLLKRNCSLYPSPSAGERAIVIGDFSEIHENCVLRTFAGRIRIGNLCSINRDSIIWGDIRIADKVRIGPRATLTSVNHLFGSVDLPILSQGSESDPVTIHEDVWLGANVTVLPGVVIGRGAIVGAGSVVTKNVPPFFVVAGVPARLIKKRE